MFRNQSGRSMIEMLGVLAIIGVLSVGGLDMLNKAKHNNQIATLLASISNLGATVVQQHQYATEIKTSYNKNYYQFLVQTGKMPNGITELGNTVTATVDDNDVVVIKVTSLDREACLKVASNNYGTRRSTRFVGVIVGDTANFSCVKGETPCTAGTNSAFPETSGYPMPIAKATSACSSATSNTVNLGYKL